VSASLQKGFFGTIRTELGAQMADLKNQFEAKLGLMVQQAKSSKGRPGENAAGLSAHRFQVSGTVSQPGRRMPPPGSGAGQAVLSVGRRGRRDSTHTNPIISRCNKSDHFPEKSAETQALLVVSRIRRKALGMLESAKFHLVQERAAGRSLHEVLLPQPIDARKALRLPILVMVAESEGGTTVTTVKGPDGSRRAPPTL